MEKKVSIGTLPIGIKFTRIANFINILLNMIIMLLLEAIAIPNIIKAAQDIGNQPNFTVAVVIALVGFIPAVLLSIINKGLLKLNKKARICQIVISCVFLFYIPIGTVLNIPILYFMIFDKKTKEAFED